jgi:hypothetical protein
MDELRQARILEQVARQLSASARHVFSDNDLIAFLNDLHAKAVLPKSSSSHKILQLIITSGIVQPIELTSTYPFESKRYHRGPFSPYELALSLKPGSYLSHGTAAYLHKLSDHGPKMIYVNKEQSPKYSSGSLTQAGIDRAFSVKQRTSGFQLQHGRTTITLLNGKHSGRLGVVAMKGPNGELLEVTDLERTLIDIVVRPAYAGGVRHVLTAFVRSRPKVSVRRISKLLRRLDYIYPYHQAIGFYLEVAGHAPADLEVFRKPKLKFDFFLAHGIEETEFNERWRIHYPVDFRGDETAKLDEGSCNG